MIIVTGASGKLGSEVVNNLLRLVPAAEVAVSVRDPKSAAAFAERGVEVRRGDYDWPSALERAFAGADRLLIVSAGGIDHQQRVIQHGNAIRAAKRAKVKHVYYTSLVHGDRSSAFVLKAHLDTERILKQSGLAFTILRNGVYAQAVGEYLGDFASGEVVIPADGPVAWVSRDDLAAGIARLLHQGGHQAETLSLTGPEALTIRELTEMLGGLTRRPIAVRIVSCEEYVARRRRQANRPNGPSAGRRLTRPWRAANSPPSIHFCKPCSTGRCAPSKRS